MTDRDLFAEYDDAIVRAQVASARAWRERMGWPRSAALQGIGGGVARINPHGKFYEPSDIGGVAAIIIPAWSGTAPGFPEDVADLVAWVPTTDQVFVRLGVADLLGEEAVRRCEPCMGITRPLRIYSDPGSWARAHTWNDRGDHGVVVLDWARAQAALGHLVGAVEFIADNLSLGQRLRAALQPPAMPKAAILVTEAAA
ncbi:MAG: hypothetical protein ACM33T_16055 [Solirubrobacterales bacterium]